MSLIIPAIIIEDNLPEIIQSSEEDSIKNNKYNNPNKNNDTSNALQVDLTNPKLDDSYFDCSACMIVYPDDVWNKLI